MAALLLRVQTPTPGASLPSYRTLCRRLRRLHITPEDLLSLHTFGELQALARRQYHRLAHQYHPDHRLLRKGRRQGKPLTGSTFLRIAANWQWLRTFPPTALLPQPGIVLVGLFYESPTMREMDLPWALERRERPMEWGWQEWRW